ncbi:MAG: zinc ribbon domain-containing protein [Candidatus Methanoplasma sp.]|jgi:hypothetical protein|nr:zinc ribbon domain-containing protein [Candidatus Methanoplasma sp.]
MSEDVPFFCPHCGSAIHATDEFCPSCGAGISAVDAPVAQPQHLYAPQKHSTALLIVVILSAAWAAIALWQGVSIALSDFNEMRDVITKALTDSGDVVDLELVDIIVEYTRIVGYAMIVSGILTIPVVVLSLLRKHHKFAVLLCVCASIFGLIAIIGVAGFIVAYLIQKHKHEFFS